VPPVFAWLAQAGGIAAAEMLRVFNCGLGMVLAVAPGDAAAAEALLRLEGEEVMRIGVLDAAPGPAGLRIENLPERWPA
jgi:phosphoribosylformylglycinamidine cyclo-ligase